MMPAEEGQNPYSSLIFLALIIIVFYFFMIRPQVKKQKELTNYRKSLQKGDKIITSGGIYGKISEVKEEHILVEVADNVVLRISKNAVVKDTTDLGAQR
jgi:preprotein translocase subunit YajC